MTLHTIKLVAAVLLAPYLFLLHGTAAAQGGTTPGQITLGNGERNVIELDGLANVDEGGIFTEVLINCENVVTRRANSTVLTFTKVTIEKPGWIVLHPIVDGRPNGKMISGYSYLQAGLNENTSVRIDHPAASGDKFLVMLHSDVNEDRTFDFVFVEDGVNVEDKAVFEGRRMIAHIISVP
ncbi:MAG: hypothetical protein AAFY29_16300 [Pseudomonadota bacterium]